MQSKIYVYIQAYNAEGTLERAIESVLSQKYTNWNCIVCDNGSTDKTRAIIEKYVTKDSRIIGIYEEVNRRNILLDRVIPLLLIDGNIESDMFCMLDADDEYYSDFFISAISDMKEHKADIVVTGSDFYSIEMAQITGQRALAEAYIIKDVGFEIAFPIYHQFTRTIWGKLFRLSVLARMDMSKLGKLAYGGDTLFSQEAFLKSEIVYIQSAINHRYYVYPKSVSRVFDKERIYSEEILFEFAAEYLFIKCKGVSARNLNFLSDVYIGGIEGTIQVLMGSNITDREKLQYLHDLLTLRTSKMFAKSKTAEALFMQIARGITSVKGTNDRELLKILARIYVEMGIYPMACNGYTVKDLLILQLEIRDNWIDKTATEDIDNSIITSIKALKYFNKATMPFLLYFKEEVFELLKGNEIQALDMLLENINYGRDIPAKLYISFIDLILDVAACADEQGIFIEVTKMKIGAFIQLGEMEEAKKLILEWEDVLASDSDFIILKDRVL